MAKKGKLYINKENKDKVKGFEEVIDLLDIESIEVIDHDQKLENYETYDYLSNEISRLNKLDTLERIRLENIANDSQMDTIINQMHQENINLYQTVSQHLSEKNSPFFNELNRMWTTYFPKKKN